MFLDPANHLDQQDGREGVGAIRDAAEVQGGRIPEATLELSGVSVGFGGGASIGGVADEAATVSVDEDGRRHHRRAGAERHNLDTAADAHGCSSECRSEVDAQRHRVR